MRRPMRRPVERRNRINDRIRVPEVRLVDEDGGQLGVIATPKALELAREKGVDLVEVSPTAQPPVCKLMDYGKFSYEQNKKQKEAKKKQTQMEVKEVKFRPKIGDHDYNFKKNDVIRFLAQGDKVKATVVFRGREIVHVSYGRHILERLVKDVSDLSVVEGKPKQEGKTLSMTLLPKKQPQATPDRAVASPNSSTTS